MEYFKNLIWRIQEPAELNDIPEFLSEETVSKIPVINIPLEALVTESIKLNKTHAKSAKKKKTRQTKAGNNELDSRFKNVPGFKNLPQSSLASLTENEHEQCLIALKHMTSNYNLNYIPMKIQNALKVYKTLENKIKDEQTKYMEFVKDKWEITGVLNFKNIHSSAKEMFDQIWTSRLNRLNSYSQFYSNKNIMIPLCNDCKTMEMSKISDLISLGAIPFLDTSPREKFFLSCPSELLTSDSNKKDVTKDDLPEKLAKEHFADVVIPLSAVKRIVNLENQIWYIPISIKSYKTTVQGKTVVKKVVYFDKPLEHGNVNECYKHKIIYKKLLKDAFSCNDGYKFPESLNDGNVTINEKNWSDNLTKNVIYSNWVLRPKDENLTLNSTATVMKNNTQSPINVIVKSHVDACRKLQNGSTQPLVLAPKIEYQLQYGSEIESKSDYSRNWISLFFHPFASLIKYYIDPNTSEVIMCKEINIPKISKDSLYHHNYNPVEALSSLYIVLNTLREKEVGDYLLCRLPKYGAFANLLNASDRTPQTLDISSLKTDIFEEVPKWIPLDTTVILPNNESQNVFPGLFKWNIKKKAVAKKTINNKQKITKKKITSSPTKKRKKGKKKNKIGTKQTKQ